MSKLQDALKTGMYPSTLWHTKAIEEWEDQQYIIRDAARKVADLPKVIRRLMLAENLGDVHDEINALHDLFGLPRPEGGFFEWTDNDFAAITALGITEDT